MMEMFKGRVALIAGAADEIGEAIGLRLGKGGAKVAICDVDKSKADSVASKIRDGEGEAFSSVCDPTNGDAVKKVVKNVMDEFGKIDILVNNVDDPSGKGIRDISDDEWEQSINSNLKSVFLFCREVAPGMTENSHGRIISLGSLDYLGWPGKVNYSAAKSGIFGFTRSLALELAKDAVTVNCVCKGDIKTSGLDMSGEEEAKKAKGLPVQRLGTPDDIARTVCFFASDSANYLTGQTLFVCGGKSLYFSMSV